MEGSGASKRRNLSVSMGKANLYVLVTSGPVTVLLAVVYAAFWGRDSLSVQGSPTTWIVALGLFVVSVVIHEALHGLSWA